jgi:phosphoribulokinase
VILFENANITIMLDHVISQRDMAERGHSLESIKASINARKPDFDAYIGMLVMP